MPITVLQIIPNLGGGGAEQACAEIAAGLKSRGDRAIVVSSGGSRVRDVLAAGGEHIEHDVATKNPARILNNAVWLRDLIRREKVDIVHARSRAPAWSAWLASRAARVGFVTTFHAAYKFSSAPKRLYNSVMARGEIMIAISQFVADYIRESYKTPKERIRVIYRGIDLKKFSPQNIDEDYRKTMRVKWGIGESEKVILFPGRLSRIKGHELFIEAFALLQKMLGDASTESGSPAARCARPEDDKGNGVVAVIIGDVQGRTGYRRELQKLMDDKGVSAKIKMIDHCSEMPTAYSLADVVVVPSLVPEGFGRVPVEAMAMGVPVIASDLGATRETIKDGTTGWLLPPENPQAWADAMLKALNLSPGTRRHMSSAAIERANGMFSEKQMVEATLKVYDEVFRMLRMTVV